MSKTDRPQYDEKAKRDHVNLKEKEYAIFAAGAKIADTPLDGLLNVSDTSPTAGQVLTFNTVTNEWEPANPSGGTGAGGPPGLDKIMDRWPLDLNTDEGDASPFTSDLPPAVDQLIDRNTIDLLHGGKGSAQSGTAIKINAFALTFIGY